MVPEPHQPVATHTGRNTLKVRAVRTKTGCFTCRSRRKKCDEQRDAETGACERCRNANVECLGFPPLKSAPQDAHRRKGKERGGGRKKGKDTSNRQETRLASTSVSEGGDRGQDAAQKEAQLGDTGVAEEVGVLRFPPSSSADLPTQNEQWQKENAGAWADPFALDSGDQMLYESMLLDSMLANQPQEDAVGLPCTSTSSHPASAHVESIPTRLAGKSIDTAVTPDQEDRALTVLADIYGMFCWHRWQPLRRTYTKDELVLALKERLQSSDLLCISVACVALCYGLSENSIMLPQNTLMFLSEWPNIFHLILSTKIIKLCAFLDWLGETSQCEASGHQHKAAAASIRQAIVEMRQEEDIVSSKRQGEMLFFLASQVLQQVACAAHQDQELPLNRATPLDTAALAHVDKFLHAAMDLALFSYASQSSQAFLAQLEAAKNLVNSLLGQSQSVRLRDLQSIHVTGLRSFVWADITNAVLSGRSTILHYLPETSTSSQSKQRRADGQEKIDTQDGLSFGCPDEVLVIMASTANLHFQLRHARNAGALPGSGPESLPAWALHSAQELSVSIELSQTKANARQHPSRQGKKKAKKAEKHTLGTMWRHAAFIFLNTTIHRQGPLSVSNQQHLRIILQLYKGGALQMENVTMGNSAMPLLFASFVAVTPKDREACLTALQEIGKPEASRESYRRYVERLWKQSDDSGFGVLWQDLLAESKETLAIM